MKRDVRDLSSCMSMKGLVFDGQGKPRLEDEGRYQTKHRNQILILEQKKSQHRPWQPRALNTSGEEERTPPCHSGAAG